LIAGGPKPVAPFSHAVETDGFVLVTGQMPDTPALIEIDLIARRPSPDAADCDVEEGR
jgi:enamine deaminase RidA (YjgF/YER057c/UK114 family)